MRVLRREDYEKLARDAVSQLVNDSVPLSNSLVKMSNDMGLNPDQIKALVQVANTLAHLDLFDRKDDGDKFVTFNPADPDGVLKDVVTSGPELEGSPCSDCSGGESYDRDQDYFSSLSAAPEAPPAPPSGLGVEDAAPGMSPHQQQITIIKIRKVAEELNQRKIAAALNYEETLHKLAAEFAKLYGPNFEEFEKNAVDAHGGDAIPILADLRNMLRLPEIKLAVFEKTARLVDTGTPEMVSFGQLKSYAEDSKSCEAAQQLLQAEVGGIL